MTTDLNFKLEYAIRLLNSILDTGIAGYLNNLNLDKLAADIEMLETSDPIKVDPCFDRFDKEITVGDIVDYEGVQYKVQIGKFGLFITIDHIANRVASLYQHKLEILTAKGYIPVDHNGVEIREGHQILYKGIEHTVFFGKQGLSISINWEETLLSSLLKSDLEIF